MNLLKKIIIRTLFVFIAAIISMPVFSQTGTDDFIKLYNNGEFQKSLDIVEKKLNDIYSKRVDDKRVPTAFITVKPIEHKYDLKKIFRNRKASGFLIEDNSEISTLHLYAARCYFKLEKNDYSISHYIQSLRFKKIEYFKDDIIFYEISQVYKKSNYFNAYINSLELAYTLNQDKYAYSYELGTALYNTNQKKKAIFHLEKYIKSSNESFDPKLYLMLGNLYEDIEKYLETEKYYIEYLKKKPDDGYILFALGYIAYLRTGNYSLAVSCFNRSLELLPEKEIFRRSKAYEYKGDMAFNDLEFAEAYNSYMQTIKYQDQIAGNIAKKKADIQEIGKKINDLKSLLLKEQNFDKYEEYEYLLDEKGKEELFLSDMEKEYNKLNAGKVRWNIADSLERMEKLDEAIKYYREAIAFNYKSNDAREKIVKLKLKIKRGY